MKTRRYGRILWDGKTWILLFWGLAGMMEEGLFFFRFCDVSRAVRYQMVQSCGDIFCNRPELRKDIAGMVGSKSFFRFRRFKFRFLDALVQRSRDPEEDVRHEVIVAISAIIKQDYAHLSNQFLSVLKDRTLDKKVSASTFFFLHLICNLDGRTFSVQSASRSFVEPGVALSENSQWTIGRRIATIRLDQE